MFYTQRFSFTATSLCFTASLLNSFYTSAELSAKVGHLLRQLHSLEVCLLLGFFLHSPINANMSCTDDRKKTGDTLKSLTWKKSGILEILLKPEPLFTYSYFCLSYMSVQQKMSRPRYISLLKKTLSNMVLFNKLWAHRVKPPQCTHWFFS